MNKFLGIAFNDIAFFEVVQFAFFLDGYNAQPPFPALDFQRDSSSKDIIESFVEILTKCRCGKCHRIPP